MPLIPALGRQRQADLCEFKASLVYIGNSRRAKAVIQTNPVSTPPHKKRVSPLYTYYRKTSHAKSTFITEAMSKNVSTQGQTTFPPYFSLQAEKMCNRFKHLEAVLLFLIAWGEVW